jgi:FkbM family methyltransferase
MLGQMNNADVRFRAAIKRIARLYTISEQEPLLGLVDWSSIANGEAAPRPDLALQSLSPAGRAVIERYLRMCPASLAAELAEGDYLSEDEPNEPPVVITYASRSGSNFFCHCAYQAGITSLPALEIMHPDILPFFALALGAATVTQYLHLLSSFYQRRDSRRWGRFAFKLDYASYSVVKSSSYWLCWAPFAFYVRLRRVDLERQAASLYKASVTHRWSSFQQAEAAFDFSVQGLLDSYDGLLEQENSWDSFYERSTNVATLFYEEFRDEPTVAVDELFQLVRSSPPSALDAIQLADLPTAVQSDALDDILTDLIRSLRGVTTTQLVERVYRLVLRRSADADGLHYWSNTAQAQGFESTLGSIFNSDERRNLKMSDAAARAARPTAANGSNDASRDPYYAHATVHEILHLEQNIQEFRDTSFRVSMTTSCHDCAAIPKVEDAGRVLLDGQQPIQIMHNGIRVIADGYYGPWMTEIIRRLRGHHEPQEELIFHHVMELIQGEATMLELGGFWSYYTMWFLHRQRAQRRAFVIEPDPNHLAVGRRNAELNGLTIEFIQAAAGPESREAIAFHTETAGLQTIEQVCVPDMIEKYKIKKLDLLHCDAQGVEFDILQSCEGLFKDHRIDFAFISTHDKSISGDPLTHQRCLAFLRFVGAQILAEHDVHESYSGDGLIVSYSGEEEIEFPKIHLTLNRYSSSLPRNPLVDLALAQSKRSIFNGRPASRDHGIGFAS